MSASPALHLTTASGVRIGEVPSEVRSSLSGFMARVELSESGLPGSVAVTSKLAGEGVTFVSRALASALVLDLGRRVCLVEANFWSNPDGVNGLNEGFAGALSGEAQIEDLAIATNVDGLDLIVRGEDAEATPALVSSSDALASTVKALSERYDTVVLDLPAMETSPGGIRAAGISDGVLLVAQHASIRVDQIDQAVEDLGSSGLLGVVLNDFKLKTPGFIRRRILDR